MKKVEGNECPLVSVIMATYNEKPEIVKAAADSILRQSYKNIELLIMDDSKDPETVARIDQIGRDPRVKVIRGETRMGLSGARNVGLKQSKGKYIAIMDGDDISLPHRIEHQAAYLERHPECFVLGGQTNIIDENGTVISKRRYPLKGVRLKIFAVYRNPISHPAVMFRRELYEKGFLYDESLEMSEDLDLWLRIMNSGFEIRNLDETVVNFRVGNQFMEKRTGSRQKAYTADVRKKNWSSSHPLFSIASVAAGKIFRLTPSSALVRFYKKENRQ